MSESKHYIPALRYDWLTKVYDPVVQLSMPERKLKSALIDQMKIKPHDRVLDFGCGSLTLTMMAAMANPDTEFFGLDIDEKILTIGSQKLNNTSLQIRIQQYDGKMLPYPDKYFDRIMSSLVFHHLTLPQKYFALNEIFRVLKPGGEFHIADFGKPADRLQRVAFYGVQLLDGFSTTNDNVRNLLWQAINEVFSEAEETGSFRTLVGTVRLMKGKKAINTIL